LSSVLVAGGIVLGVDAFLVAILGNAPLTQGGTAAWQLGLAGIALTTLGGNIAGFGNALIGLGNQSE